VVDGPGTLVCPGCGAGVSRAAAACPYCGAQVVLPKPVGADAPAPLKTFCTRCGLLYPAGAPRCPRCPPASVDPAKGGRCPRCAGDLEPVAVGRVTVDRCRACRGHWFDGEAIEHAIDLTTRGVTRDEALAMRRTLPVWKQPLEPVRYLACVRCGERMTRRPVVPQAGMIVDVCREHGVWFDAGEFEHFASFARAGGLEVMRHDGIAKAEAKARLAGSETPPSAWVGTDPGVAGSAGAGILDALANVFLWGFPH
jgi:Zn-finger nucleic acid-binding protein